MGPHFLLNLQPEPRRLARSLLRSVGRARGVPHHEEVFHGEYDLNLDLAPVEAGNARPVVFMGRDRVDAKRRALDYWYRRPRLRGVTLRDFLHCCRLSGERVITFYPSVTTSDYLAI